MPDYAKMYHLLFNAQTQAIEILQKAQQDAEEMYISSPEPEVIILDKSRHSMDTLETDEANGKNRGAKKQAPVSTAVESN